MSPRPKQVLNIETESPGEIQICEKDFYQSKEYE